MATGPKLVKLVVQLPPDAWHGYGTESVWAEPLGQDRYRLRNSPFFATGLSAEDIVVALPALEGALRFERVLRHSGHSTYRLAREPGGSAMFDQHWAKLEQLGCTYEEGPSGILSVDVPPRSDIYDVYRAIEDGATAGAWDFEEGHVGHPLTQRPDVAANQQ